jgi:hypothetical protein
MSQTPIFQYKDIIFNCVVDGVTFCVAVLNNSEHGEIEEKCTFLSDIAKFELCSEKKV